VGVGLLVGDVTLNRGPRGVTLGLLRRRQDRESWGIPGYARLLNNHGNHEVVALSVMRGHMLRHRRRGHGKGGAGLADILAGILHGYLRVGQGLVMLTRHARAGGHLMRIYGAVHGVGWVLEKGGLRVGGDWSMRSVGKRTALTLRLRIRDGYGARLLDGTLSSGRHGTGHYMLGMRLRMMMNWMGMGGGVSGWGLRMWQTRVTHRFDPRRGSRGGRRRGGRGVRKLFRI